MNVRHRLLSLAASAALSASAAAGQSITIEGPQGHSTASPVEESSSTGDGIPPWEYGPKRQPRNLSRIHTASERRYKSNIRYAGGFPNRRGIDSRRGPFRYRIQEFQKRRFADLRPNTQGARFKASTSSYRPAISYTSSFGGRNRFGSTIRYRSR
jgi:hypothetical protein